MKHKLLQRHSSQVFQKQYDLPRTRSQTRQMQADRCLSKKWESLDRFRVKTKLKCKDSTKTSVVKTPVKRKLSNSISKDKTAKEISSVKKSAKSSTRTILLKPMNESKTGGNKKKRRSISVKPNSNSKCEGNKQVKRNISVKPKTNNKPVSNKQVKRKISLRPNTATKKLKPTISIKSNSKSKVTTNRRTACTVSKPLSERKHLIPRQKKIQQEFSLKCRPSNNPTWNELAITRRISRNRSPIVIGHRNNHVRNGNYVPPAFPFDDMHLNTIQTRRNLYVIQPPIRKAVKKKQLLQENRASKRIRIHNR